VGTSDAAVVAEGMSAAACGAEGYDGACGAGAAA